jgi:hypothetical protein
MSILECPSCYPKLCTCKEKECGQISNLIHVCREPRRWHERLCPDCNPRNKDEFNAKPDFIHIRDRLAAEDAARPFAGRLP